MVAADDGTLPVARWTVRPHGLDEADANLLAATLDEPLIEDLVEDMVREQPPADSPSPYPSTHWRPSVVKPLLYSLPVFVLLFCSAGVASADEPVMRSGCLARHAAARGHEVPDQPRGTLTSTPPSARQPPGCCATTT